MEYDGGSVGDGGGMMEGRWGMMEGWWRDDGV